MSLFKLLMDVPSFQQNLTQLWHVKTVSFSFCFIFVEYCMP